MSRAALGRYAAAGRITSSHLFSRVDQLLVALDATSPPRPVVSPLFAVIEDDDDATGLEHSLSSSAHVAVFGDAARGRRVRAALPTAPVIALVDETRRPSDDAEHRWELRTRFLEFADLIGARGELRADRLPTTEPHPLVNRYEGVAVVRTHGGRALAALSRLAKAARRGLWWRIAPRLAASVVVLPDACALVTDAAPVPPLRRVWVRNGRLSACAHGPALGNVGTAPPSLTESAFAAQREARERRGCARCPAEPYCGACPCAAGVAEATYCETMRSFAPMGPPPLEQLTQMPAIARRVAAVDDPPREAEALLAVSRRLTPQRVREWRRFAGDTGARFAQNVSATVLVRARPQKRVFLVGPRDLLVVPSATVRGLTLALTGRPPAEAADALAADAGLASRAARAALRALIEAHVAAGGRE
jgi:radical SAM protein with 4Fe4S-binding SPASM domain